MKHNIVKSSICAVTALSCVFAFAPAAFAVRNTADVSADVPTAGDAADESATPGDGDQETPDTPDTPSYKTKIKKGFTFAAGKATYKVTKLGKSVKCSVADNADGSSNTTYTYTGEVELVAYKGGKKASVPQQVKAQIQKAVENSSFKEKGTFAVVSIGKSAFDNSKGHKVTSVSVGKNVVSIGDKAFYNCKKLTKITLKGDALRTVGPNSDKSLNRKSASYVKKLYKLRSKKWKMCKVFSGVPRTCSILLPNINPSKGLKYNIEYANAVRLLTGNAGYVGVVK